MRHAAAAADLFCARFSPHEDMSEADAEARADEIRATITRDVEHDMVQVRSVHAPPPPPPPQPLLIL